MANNMIETFDLTKIYKLKGGKKKITALNNIDISIKENEIFGLLGPNGAGKTTLLKILTTLIQPTSGYALVDGYNVLNNPKKAKNRIALMIDSQMIYYRLTGYDNLKFCCKIYKVQNYKQEIQNIAEEFGLKNWLNQYVENFSAGMKMKLALCRTILLDRKILLLDEPTLGLDVNTTAFIIKKLKKFKGTILLTTHNMSVAEKLCNRIAFINKGNIIKIGTQEDIARLIQKEIKIKIEIFENENKLKSELNQLNFINEVINENKGFIITLKSRENYNDLLSILRKYKVLKLNEQDLALGDLFLKII